MNKKLLSVYIAKQFGGQHQQPAFFSNDTGSLQEAAFDFQSEYEEDTAAQPDRA